MSRKFVFSSPSNEFMNNGIDVCGENVLYNWMDRASMFISKVGIPFRAAKEMYLVVVQALINDYSKIGSCDLFTSIGKSPSSTKIIFILCINSCV